MLIDQMIMDGILGFYTSVQATTFYCYDRKSKSNFNLLTIWTLVDEDSQEYITSHDKYGELTKDYIWGKVTYKFNKTDIKNNIDNIIKFQSFEISGAILLFDNLKEKEKYPQFIPSSSENRIRSLFDGCFDNHVFEYYNSIKESLQLIIKDDLTLKKIVSKIAESNINLEKCTDAIGNLYIQIPCNLIIGLTRPTKTTIKLQWNNKVINKPRTSVHYIINKQYNETQYFTTPLGDDDIIQFRSNTENIKIIIQRNDLLTSIFSSNNCPRPDIPISVGMHLDLHRTFTNADKPAIEIKSFRGTSLGRINSVNEAIYSAQSAFLVQELIRERKFSQYPSSIDREASNHSAEEFIKELIKEYGGKGFVIWDPYITSQEVIKYVVESYSYNSNIKILTSKKVYDKLKGITREDYFEHFKNEITNYSNGVGLNIEIRCSWGPEGTQFHDRFIIFPETGIYKECIGWSLGISLNQVGREHHIIQKVDDARGILYSFNIIWNNLNDSHVIYKITP